MVSDTFYSPRDTKHYLPTQRQRPTFDPAQRRLVHAAHQLAEGCLAQPTVLSQLLTPPANAKLPLDLGFKLMFMISPNSRGSQRHILHDPQTLSRCRLAPLRMGFNESIHRTLKLGH